MPSAHSRKQHSTGFATMDKISHLHPSYSCRTVPLPPQLIFLSSHHCCIRRFPRRMTLTTTTPPRVILPPPSSARSQQNEYIREGREEEGGVVRGAGAPLFRLPSWTTNAFLSLDDRTPPSSLDDRIVPGTPPPSSLDDRTPPISNLEFVHLRTNLPTAPVVLLPKEAIAHPDRPPRSPTPIVHPDRPALRSSTPLETFTSS